MLPPNILCCVQAWISPLQLGELHGSPTYAAGAEKGMLTRISSGSSLRRLATGPLSRSGSCSILVLSCIAHSSQAAALATLCTALPGGRCTDETCLCNMCGCSVCSLTNPQSALSSIKQARGRMPAQFAMQKPMQHNYWQLSSAKQL